MGDSPTPARQSLEPAPQCFPEAEAVVHGGDVWQIAERLGIPASDLLDFSANINPRGLPHRARQVLARDAGDPQLPGRYPDPNASRLRDGLSKQLGVSRDAIVVGPGAEALLTPIMRCVGANRALVPIPSFSEYRRVCSRERIEFIPFPLDRGESFQVSVDRFCARIEAVTPGLVLLNNPHNPSGALLQAKEVRRIAETAISVGATLVLDEAFIDYAPEATLIREAAEKLSLIVIRSLTKFYGCPALRVGYAVAHPAAIRSIRSYLPTWPVTQFALDALSEAVTDVEFAETSLRENATERERLASALAALGLVVFSSAANYLLLELRDNMPSASELRERLIAAHRIAIRNCDSYEGLAHGRFVRVAVRSAADNDRLIGALQRELT